MRRIIEQKDGGRSLYILNDGCDYPGLLAAYSRGEIAGTPLSGGTAGREKIRFEHGGRQFLLKTDARRYRHWDARLKFRLYGPPFLPTMRKVAKAVDAGCDLIQQMYLIEQTVTRDAGTGDIVVAVRMLIEYLPGELLQNRPEFASHIPPLFRELHRHKLVQTDPSHRNFVVSHGRLKVIDMHFFSNPFITVWPRSVMKIVDFSGLAFPLDSMFDRAVYRLARGKAGSSGFFGDERVREGFSLPSHESQFCLVQ